MLITSVFCAPVSVEMKMQNILSHSFHLFPRTNNLRNNLRLQRDMAKTNTLSPPTMLSAQSFMSELYSHLSSSVRLPKYYQDCITTKNNLDRNSTNKNA